MVYDGHWNERYHKDVGPRQRGDELSPHECGDVAHQYSDIDERCQRQRLISQPETQAQNCGAGTTVPAPHYFNDN